MPNWGQGAQGAAGGAMAGSAFGPWGAAAGGAIGGAIGLFGGGGGPKYDQELKRRLVELERQYAARNAPQGTAAQGSMSSFRENQAALVRQQEAMARGEGPSAAALQMQEALGRSTAATNAQAAGGIGRGVNAGAALRGAANTNAGLMAQSARDTGLARVNEQIGAMNQLGLTLHGARGADETMGRFNVAQQNEMTQANMQAILASLGLNDRSQLQALAQAMGTYRGETPGLGTQVMAGGAAAMPGMMQAFGKGPQQPGAANAQPVAGGPMPWSPSTPIGTGAGWAVQGLNDPYAPPQNTGIVPSVTRYR